MTGLLRDLGHRIAGNSFLGWLPPQDEAVASLIVRPGESGRDGVLKRHAWVRIASTGTRNWLAGSGSGWADCRSARSTDVIDVEGGAAPVAVFGRITIRTTIAGREAGKLLLLHEVRGPGGERIGRVSSRIASVEMDMLNVFPPLRVSGLA